MKTSLMLWLVYLNVLLLTSYYISARVPAFYMDEIFHGPQAQAYCALNFGHWDNKITTPPGLYIISAALNWASVGLWPCNVFGLRAVNTLLGSFFPLVLRDIYGCIHPTNSQTRNLQHGFSVAALPVLWFFNFLYYTDVASTLFILLSYRACLRGKYGAASAVCLDLPVFVNKGFKLTPRYTNRLVLYRFSFARQM